MMTLAPTQTTTVMITSQPTPPPLPLPHDKSGFQLLSQCDPMSIIVNFFDFEYLFHTLLYVNKDFYHWVTSSIESVYMGPNLSDRKCRVMFRFLLRHCRHSLQKLTIKNENWQGERFEPSLFPRLTTFQCLNRLQDRSIGTFLPKLLLIQKCNQPMWKKKSSDCCCMNTPGRNNNNYNNNDGDCGVRMNMSQSTSTCPPVYMMESGDGDDYDDGYDCDEKRVPRAAAVARDDNDDPNPFLRNLNINLNNMRENDSLDGIVQCLNCSTVDKSTVMYQCRQLDSIILSNSHTRSLASLLYHMLCHSWNHGNGVVKHLELRDVSNIHQVLYDLRQMIDEHHGGTHANKKFRVSSLRFFSCKTFTDETLSLLCHIFDHKCLRELYLEMMGGDITVQGGWNAILPHFHGLTHFSCDSFTLKPTNNNNNNRETAWADAFRSLLCLTQLESLNLSFFKFREDLEPEDREHSHLLGSSFIQSILPLDHMKQMVLVDMGELLNQDSLDNAFIFRTENDGNCFTSLTKLKICNAKITCLDPLFELIHNTIEELQIEYCCSVLHIMKNIDRVPNFPRLRSLNLTRMKYLPSSTIDFIANKMSHVQNLNLADCISISTLKDIGKLSNIRQLTLSGLELLTDNDLRYLAPLRDLSTLNLTSLRNLNGRGFFNLLKQSESHDPSSSNSYIPLLPNLRVLHMDWCKFLTNEFLQHIQWFTSLEYLSFIHSERLERFELLGRLTNLQFLYLNRVPLLRDETLIELVTNTPNISVLHINGGHRKLNHAVTNESLKAIGQNLKQLRSLEMNFCGRQFTDDGLHYIKPLADHLVTCNFFRCPGVTRTALQKVLTLSAISKESDNRFKSMRNRCLSSMIIPFLVGLLSFLFFAYQTNLFEKLVNIRP